MLTWRRSGSKKQPLALMMIDVDYFKRYNDRYGHQAGDECLSSVAQVLKMAVRAEGDLVARYGGEEFVVVLPGVSPAHATAIAERIQQKGSARAGLPHAASVVASEVTVSIGIVASGWHGPDRDADRPGGQCAVSGEK